MLSFNKLKRFLYAYIWVVSNLRFVLQLRLIWRQELHNNISTIVFSKDRALQLHSLLRSFFLMKRGTCSIVVLYAASNAAHEKAYEELEILFQGKVYFVKEALPGRFAHYLSQALDLLPCGRLFFLVDDIIFINDVDYDHLSQVDTLNTVFSLRMGNHLTHSYVIDKPQPLPTNLRVCDDFLYWRWGEGVYEWGYPLSVDGHIFSTLEVALWIKNLRFFSPTSFENSLQPMRNIYKRKLGKSFVSARLVNIPANKVQTENTNLHGLMHQDELLNKWEQGFIIDHTKLSGYVNSSAHEEIEFSFIKRTSMLTKSIKNLKKDT